MIKPPYKSYYTHVVVSMPVLIFVTDMYNYGFNGVLQNVMLNRGFVQKSYWPSIYLITLTFDRTHRQTDQPYFLHALKIGRK